MAASKIKIIKLCFYFLKQTSVGTTTSHDSSHLSEENQVNTNTFSSSLLQSSEPLQMDVECAHEDNAEAEIVSNEVPVPLPNHSIFGNSSPSPLQPDSFNYFSRPHDAFLESFFKYHPCQPVLDSDLPFNRKVFCGKNELKREWLTYSTIKKALFCSCCLAFGKDREKSSFEQGMKDWRHVFQRVVEHEKSDQHCNCVEAHDRHKISNDISGLLGTSVLLFRKDQVNERRKVLVRVIETIKLIGKRGLSYRGKRNESGYTLHDENKDHGNFFGDFAALWKI